MRLAREDIPEPHTAEAGRADSKAAAAHDRQRAPWSLPFFGKRLGSATLVLLEVSSDSSHTLSPLFRTGMTLAVMGYHLLVMTRKLTNAMNSSAEHGGLGKNSPMSGGEAF